MKAQMSLEMLAYLSLAGLSMLYSAKAVSVYYSDANGSLASYGYASFVESINSAILQDAGHAVISIPAGLCNSTLSGDMLHTARGDFYFVRGVRASQSVMCGTGQENVSIGYGQGNISLG
ncbi:MAG: hypothetical protein ACYCO0_03145 [Candidatus Micrarchaeaceae archaeon]